MNFGTINGVSLSDDKRAVAAKMGRPVQVIQDKWLAERTKWVYSNMTVGFSGSLVEYISVPASSGSVEVGGERLPIRLHAWVGRFGTPTFAGDDGAGYVDANGIAAKLFWDSRTGQAVSVDFFWQIAE